MTDRLPRTREQRKTDTLTKLSAPAADVWVATAAADAGGHASSYLVPLSLAWIDERVVLATEADSAHSQEHHQPAARPASAWGPTRDVVMIDAELEQAHGLDRVPATLAQQYAMQAGWDPRKAGRPDAVPGCCARCGSRPGGRGQ